MNEAAKPLKIFISYGHEIDVKDDNGNLIYPEPNNESVVRKIKTFLESRGHKVWLDTDQIKEGKDWRRKIYEGIEDSNVVIVCLSRKAMKPNGVCRDEIAIAIGVCGRNLFPVKLEDSSYPSYLTNYQFINDFQEWSSHISADTIDEAWLDKNLEKLAKLLEKENVRQYFDEIVELKNFLRPWNMNSRLKKLDTDIHYHYNKETKETEKTIVHEFCGRESLFKMFEEQLVQGGEAVRKESQRVLWLRKGPGFGKSRFAAELHYRYCYAIRAAYFIEYNQRESFKPQTFVKSVAFQLAQANNSYRKKLMDYLKGNLDNINLQTGDSQTLFRTLIVDQMVNEIDGNNGTQWILVDALDEATDNGRNEIASLISQNLDNLPSWLCFFITSRDSDAAVNRNFSQFSPIEFSDEENKIDVREYILNEINKRRITVQGDPEELVNILHEKSEGTFLYPEMVFRDLTEDSISLEDIRSLPSGVLGYIHKRFDYLYGNNIELYDHDVRPALGYILTSCEPIPRGVLKYSLGIERDSEFNKRLKALGTFFIQSGATDTDTIVPFHKSIKDYCFDIEKSTEDYCIYPEEANKDFASSGLELFKTGALQWATRTDEEPNTVQRYFLNWLPSHLMNANMTKEAAAVLSDFAFLMKRLRFGNVERVILDYFLFRGKLGRISKESDSYFDVICSAAHYLRRNCKDNPAYKTMLQIATEIADECPVTQAAERWLNPETGDSPCDWFWLNKVNRSKEYHPNPCKLVIENAGDSVKLLSNGDALSWGTDDNNLRIWDLETGVCKAVLKGHTGGIGGAIELHSGDILSWSSDKTLRLWALDGACKAVFEGHKDGVNGVIELRSGDILSWSDDYTLRLWTPDGTCKAILEGHTHSVKHVIELGSGDILSWCNGYKCEDYTLRIWSREGTCKAVIKGHTSAISGAIELSSGDILSWGDKFEFSYDIFLRLWSPDGVCKAILEGHNVRIDGVIELRSGNILSWGFNTLRIWSPEGTCKTVFEGHKGYIRGAKELRSGDILSWSRDKTLRLWSPDGTCKAVLEGHTDEVIGAIELRSGDILSWDYSALRLWSPDGTRKAVLEGYTLGTYDAIELCSGDILSWDKWLDNTLRIWSPDGIYKTVMKEGHTDRVKCAIELSSNNFLSWSYDNTLRLWSPDGACKAVLNGHTDEIRCAIELSSGDILSWCGENRAFGDSGVNDNTLRLWSPDGVCKAVLDRHSDDIFYAIELRSGDILSWSRDGVLCLWSPDGTRKSVMKERDGCIYRAIELGSGDILSEGSRTLSIWSPDGTCKAVLEENSDNVSEIIGLPSGDILSLNKDKTLRLWTPDGICKEVLESDNPKYDLYYALLHPQKVQKHFYAKVTDLGIDFQHDLNPFVLWNGVKCNSFCVGAGRICVWYSRYIELLQLNYGNHMSVSFDQAHQLLSGEIDESKLVTFLPEPKKGAIPKTE